MVCRKGLDFVTKDSLKRAKKSATAAKSKHRKAKLFSWLESDLMRGTLEREQNESKVSAYCFSPL